MLIFRQPPRSSVENIFILPFDVTVWLCIGSLALIMIVVLRLQSAAKTPLNSQLVDHPDRLSWSDAVIFVVGSLCQQGAPSLPSLQSSAHNSIWGEIQLKRN